MLDAVVRVVAPSRLHFGLLAFGRPEGRQFGGVGVMLDSPTIELRAHPGRRFAAAGPHAERLAEIARAWAAAAGLSEPPACELHLLSAPPQHVGLGLGTQLSLAVARALDLLCERPQSAAEAAAAPLGRGQRSAVGSYGFARGGLIVDWGRLADEPIAPAVDRIPLSGDWRFVLLRPASGSGLSGRSEREAFQRLPPTPVEVTQTLETELRERMLPAAHKGDFDGFSESVFRYGRMAGECFAPVQGGPYNGPKLTNLVEQLRGWGILGVGQSSWGPTIFALVENAHVASDLIHRLHQHFPGELDISTSAVSQAGAQSTIE